MNQRISANLFRYRGFWHPVQWNEARKNLAKLVNGKNKDWDKAFYRMIRSRPELLEVAQEFYSNPVSSEKQVKFSDDRVVLITLVKDDLYRITKLLNHYRRLGITQFAVIDNNSTDGTKEYLLKENDVALYSAKVPYTTNRREAWINSVVAHYGMNRWYVIVDSDELISYSGMEQHPLPELVKWAEKQGIKRIRGMMLDMYPKTGSFAAENLNDPYQEYCYFDSDTYTEKHNNEFDEVRGGFRKRTYGSNPLLTKYPVVFWERGDIQMKSHYMFPYEKNIGHPCYLALRHYKFIPTDFEKYKKIASDGNFYNGSIQYKEYVGQYDENRVNMYKGSVKYENSHSLERVVPLKKIKWEERMTTDAYI